MKYAKEIIKEIENRGIINTDDYFIDDDWEDYIRGKRGTMRTILDYIFCFIIKRLPPCKLEKWMIRQLVTWIRR